MCRFTGIIIFDPRIWHERTVTSPPVFGQHSVVLKRALFALAFHFDFDEARRLPNPDMPCWIKALPRAATIVCIIFSKSSLTAAASLDNGLQLSQPIVPRSVISIPEIVPRQVQNVFVNPSGVPSDKDFSNNPVFEIDTVVEIQWVMDGTVTEEVSLFLSVGINS